MSIGKGRYAVQLLLDDDSARWLRQLLAVNMEDKELTNEQEDWTFEILTEINVGLKRTKSN